MRNIRLVVAFDGTNFHGWQIQPGARTVQGSLCQAVEQITQQTVAVTGSGRTDAGAHARGLIANFHTTSPLAPAQFLRALNGLLPQDVRILSAREAAPSFHARRDALSKVYRYQVYRGKVMPPHLAREHFHYPYPIDLEQMKLACDLFAGAHDFARFAARSGRSEGPSGHPAKDRNTVRHIFRSEMKRTGRRLLFTFEGNGFLHHMVRNMVGTLLEIGRGQLTVEQFAALFKKRDRTLAGFTAPAHGLTLVRVKY